MLKQLKQKQKSHAKYTGQQWDIRFFTLLDTIAIHFRFLLNVLERTLLVGNPLDPSIGENLV